MIVAEPHVVVVEDDKEISGLLAPFLGRHGFRVSIVENGTALGAILHAETIDAVILDIMLPGEDGLSLCRRLRASSTVPIIMLTALGHETDRIVGLEMGADDYLGKPFNPRELLARLRAVLRRCRGGPAPSHRDLVFEFEGWRLHPGLRQLRAPDGARVQLTSMEFDLLVIFCQRPRQVLSREMLQDMTLGRAALGRGVDIQVSRIRKKIERDPRDPILLLTVRTGGYFFAPTVLHGVDLATAAP